MTKEEAKKFGLQLLHGIMERNGSYPVYANNVKQAIEALSEPNGSSEIPNDLEEAAKAYADDTNPTDSFYEAFKEGALWMREQLMKELSEKIASAYQLGLADKEKQLMKEAVEGKIINAGYPTKIELNTFYSKFEHGQKVPVIIVKEG